MLLIKLSINTVFISEFLATVSHALISLTYPASFRSTFSLHLLSSPSCLPIKFYYFVP
jgi:hypothetical protein